MLKLTKGQGHKVKGQGHKVKGQVQMWRIEIIIDKFLQLENTCSVCFGLFWSSSRVKVDQFRWFRSTEQTTVFSFIFLTFSKPSGILDGLGLL